MLRLTLSVSYFLPSKFLTAIVTKTLGLGKVIDWDYRATANKLGITINKEGGDDLTKFPIEKARIRSIWYFIAISIASTIVYGWTIEHQVHLSVPLIMQFLCGLATTGVFNVNFSSFPSLTQLIDLYRFVLHFTSICTPRSLVLPVLLSVSLVVSLQLQGSPSWNYF